MFKNMIILRKRLYSMNLWCFFNKKFLKFIFLRAKYWNWTTVRLVECCKFILVMKIEYDHFLLFRVSGRGHIDHLWTIKENFVFLKVFLNLIQGFMCMHIKDIDMRNTIILLEKPCINRMIPDSLSDSFTLLYLYSKMLSEYRRYWIPGTLLTW